MTHDPEEAALLSDEIIILEGGRVLQAGPRSAGFHSPNSPEVAALLGIANTHRGRVTAPGLLTSAGVKIKALTGHLPRGSQIVWCVRPEHISLRDEGHYAGLLIDDADLGAARELTISLGRSLELTARTLDATELTVGRQFVWISGPR